MKIPNLSLLQALFGPLPKPQTFEIVASFTDESGCDGDIVLVKTWQEIEKEIFAMGITPEEHPNWELLPEHIKEHIQERWYSSFEPPQEWFETSPNCAVCDIVCYCLPDPDDYCEEDSLEVEEVERKALIRFPMANHNIPF